jgi:hypothetical protein
MALLLHLAYQELQSMMLLPCCLNAPQISPQTPATSHAFASIFASGASVYFSSVACPTDLRLDRGKEGVYLPARVEVRGLGQIHKLAGDGALF